MALTESEKTELKNDILNAIKAESQSVDELVEVSSLDPLFNFQLFLLNTQLLLISDCFNRLDSHCPISRCQAG